MSQPSRTRHHQPMGESAWRKLRDLTANESKPTSRIKCMPVSTERILWAVSLASGVTAATIHVGRWVAVAAGAQGAAVGEFFEDRRVVLSGLTGANNELVIQSSWDDPLGIYIDGITSGGETIKIAYKLINGD